MSAKTMTFCASLDNKEKLGVPEIIICPSSVYDAWEESLLNETNGVVASQNCVIINLENLV